MPPRFHSSLQLVMCGYQPLRGQGSASWDLRVEHPHRTMGPQTSRSPGNVTRRPISPPKETPCAASSSWARASPAYSSG
jgi:hypothetical protein